MANPAQTVETVRDEVRAMIASCKSDFDSLIGKQYVSGLGEQPYTAEDATRDHEECENCRIFRRALAALDHAARAVEIVDQLGDPNGKSIRELIALARHWREDTP